MTLLATDAPPALAPTTVPPVRLNCPWIDSPFFPQLLAEKRLAPDLEAMARHFNEQGFVVIDPQLDDATLSAVNRDLEPEFAKSNRIQDAFKRSEAVKKIATAPRVLEVLRALYERDPIPFQTLNFPRGTEQKTHSDTIHFHSAPSGFMCAVWVALEDIDADNGPLHYYPKSHKSPVMDYDALGIGNGLPPVGPAGRAQFLAAPQPRRGAFMRTLSRWGRWWKRKLAKRTSATGNTYAGAAAGTAELYALYEERVAQLMLAHGFERAEVRVKRGQALVWSANLYHGGSPIRDKRRTRHSQVTHYYFDRCMYYTPLMSAPKLGMYYMRKVRDIRTGQVVPQFYNGLELDTDSFND